MKNSHKALSHITPNQARMLYQVLLGNDASTLDPEKEYDSRELNAALDALRQVVLHISQEKGT